MVAIEALALALPGLVPGLPEPAGSALVVVLPLALIAAGAFAFGSAVTRRLAELEDGIGRLREGGFGHQLLAESRDELTTVARAFNRMSTTLLRRRQKEDARRAELERLALVAEEIQEGVLILDENRIIEWANRGCETLTGYSREELLGKEAPAVFKRENINPAGLARIMAELGAGRPVRQDALYYRKDGATLWVDLCLAPVLDADGVLHRFVAVQRDVTERHRMMAELDAHRHHLERLVEERTQALAEKAAELEAALEAEKSLNALRRGFVAMASHEFRTPLAIIDGVAQRQRRRAERASAADLVAWSATINTAVLRMTRLIESTLSAARMDASEIVVKPVACDFARIVEACCRHQQAISPDHEIRLELRDLPATIVADPGAVEQIVANLLSNAVKYSPRPPDSDERPLIALSAWQRDGQVHLSVRDHGLGMDEEDVGQLFRRFFRAKTSTGIAGTGIGLNLVQTLLQQHGGDIDVTSVLDEGTTFTMHLPVTARPSATADTAPASDPAGAAA
jgi:PAS domain S-box-containing protein